MSNVKNAVQQKCFCLPLNFEQTIRVSAGKSQQPGGGAWMGCSKSIVGNHDFPQPGKTLDLVKHLTFCEAMGRWLAIRREVALEVGWPFEV